MAQPRSNFLTRVRANEMAAFENLRWAELTLAATVISCALLEFNRKVNSDGLSYYGVHRRTIPILLLGLSISVFFLLRAANGFDSQGNGHLISKLLKFFCGAAIGLLLTPYSINTYFDFVHKTIGTTLFVVQLGLSLYLAEQVKDWPSWIAVSLEVVGGLAALLSLPHNSLGYQFEGQLIFQIGFFTLINHVSRGIEPGRGQPA